MLLSDSCSFECPLAVSYPFRPFRSYGEATRQGGFPPLMIDPIDFRADVPAAYGSGTGQGEVGTGRPPVPDQLIPASAHGPVR